MTKYEIVSLLRDLLKNLNAMGISTADYVKADVYRDFLSMNKSGEKVYYIVLRLSEKYSISTRTIYRIVSEMSEECQSVTLE